MRNYTDILLGCLMFTLGLVATIAAFTHLVYVHMGGFYG
jgi:hypothetical protein